VVIVAAQLEVTPPQAETVRCGARAEHRRSRCTLPRGHRSHHETHVRVRRANGDVVGFTYSWL
jgi:hypothetical protein